MLTLLLGGGAGRTLAAPAAGGTIEGAIAAVEAGGLTVATQAGGQVRVVLTPETTIISAGR